MKKLIAILLIVTFCLSAVACGGSEGTPSSTSDPSTAHEHSFVSEWSYDATHHWHACAGEGCTEVSQRGEHTWNDGEVTTEATPDATGVKTFTCSVCAQTKTEVVEYTEIKTVTEAEWRVALSSDSVCANGVLNVTVLMETSWGEDETVLFANGMKKSGDEVVSGYDLESFLGSDYGDPLEFADAYSIFTYNSEKGIYEGQEDEGEKFVLIFSNGKLVSCTIILDGGTEDEEKWTITYTNVGTTVITASATPSPESPTPDQPTNPEVDLGKYLETLLNGYQVNPYARIPETMLPAYSANLINPQSIPSNYNSFVAASQIPANGHGEQWRMVCENLQQSQMFFNALTVVEGLVSTSIVAFNNYLDQNPSQSAHHEFEQGIYSVIIDCTESDIYYVLEYTTDIPTLGTQKIQIALSMHLEDESKTVRIQIGDANAMMYSIRDGIYSFGLKYLGVRRAYFQILIDEDGNVQGNIWEYLTVASQEKRSAADFYIRDGFVTVIGDKAGAMVGFDGYVCELYDASNGKLIAYEVMETATVMGVTLTYNTLWFDLHDVQGLQSVKYLTETDSEKLQFFINGLSAAWEAPKVGTSGGLKAASRRFDIELRTQYFYVYDAANDRYDAVAIQVPMLFVQEECLDEFSDDVLEANNAALEISVSEGRVDRLTEDYSTLVEVFTENAETVTVDAILAFIGDAVEFT